MVVKKAKPNQKATRYSQPRRLPLTIDPDQIMISATRDKITVKGTAQNTDNRVTCFLIPLQTTGTESKVERKAAMGNNWAIDLTPESPATEFAIGHYVVQATARAEGSASTFIEVKMMGP